MHFKIKLILTILLFIPLCATAIEEIVLNEDTTKGSEKFNIETFIQQPYSFSFRNYRAKLEEKGIDFQSSYIIDTFAINNRSKHIKKGTYQGLYNLSLDLDFDKMKLYKGGKFHILYQVGNKGINSMEFLNSYSDLSSYDPMKSINQISELHYEQSFKDDIFNIKIGKQDANSDFQALNNGFEFLNLSFSYLDNTPMPLYPSQQMGIRARLKLPNEIYIQDGFYDGNLKIGAAPKSFFTGKNNYFNMTEVYKIMHFKEKEGKYLIGNWIKTGKYDSYKDSIERNNYGFYAGFEQKITDRFEDKSGGLSIFSQFGYARSDINDVPYYYGAGLIFKGITKKRKEDLIGLAFGWHQFNRYLHRSENSTAEKVIELFYKIKLTEFFYIQPDVQYIIKPYGVEKNALAVGLRSCIVF